MRSVKGAANDLLHGNSLRARAKIDVNHRSSRVQSRPAVDLEVSRVMQSLPNGRGMQASLLRANAYYRKRVLRSRNNRCVGLKSVGGGRFGVIAHPPFF